MGKINSTSKEQGKLKFRYKLGIFYLLLGHCSRAFALPFVLLGVGFPARRFNQISGGVLFVILLDVAMKHKDKLLDFIKKNRLLLFFFLFLTSSFMWSELPLWSLKRSIRLWILLLLIVNIFMEKNPQEIFWKMLQYFCYFVVFSSALFIFVFPQYGRSTYGKFIGIFATKNPLGFRAAIAGVLFYKEIISSADFRRRGWYLLWFILSVFLLVGSNSITAAVCFICALIIISYFFIVDEYIFKHNYNKTVISVVATVLALLVFKIVLEEVFLDSTILNTFLKFVGRVPTFTGRTKQWPPLINIGLTRPILGFGLNAFWQQVITGKLTVPGLETWWRFRSEHSGYLKIFLNLGLVGLITYSVLIVNTIMNFKKLDLKAKNNICIIGIFIMILIQNFYESSYLAANFIWFFFLFVIVTVSLSNNKSQAL